MDMLWRLEHDILRLNYSSEQHHVMSQIDEVLVYNLSQYTMLPRAIV